MRLLDRILEGFNNWLASRVGFVQAVALSVIWTVIAVTGIDRHGFWLLFTYTIFSCITQFNLGIFARRAAAEAHQARLKAELSDASTQSMLQSIDDAGDERRSVLEAMRQALSNQADMLEAIIATGERVVEVSVQETQMTATLEAMVESLQDGVAGSIEIARSVQEAVTEIQQLGKDSRALHLRNADMIAKLASRNQNMVDAVLKASQDAV